MAIKNICKWINDTLMEFKCCFSKTPAFEWLAVIVIGLMIRSDHLGLTSIVRELSLTSEAYNAMLHFFRAESWYIEGIKSKWLSIIKKLPCLITEDGRYILIADGVKQSKEGRKMPGVMKLHQESENSSKGEYIYGHLFGGLGILAGNTTKQYSILIPAMMHEGLGFIEKWRNGDDYDDYIEESHVVKMIRETVLHSVSFRERDCCFRKQYQTVSSDSCAQNLTAFHR